MLVSWISVLLIRIFLDVLQVCGMKKFIKSVPVIGTTATYFYHRFIKPPPVFPGSGSHWEERYKSGGTSGLGSYNRLAEFKADFLNNFVRAKQINSVIEFGFGDGNQLLLASYPNYAGFDVSESALEMCKTKFAQDPSKSFYLMNEYGGEKAELALSLDVSYHVVEDDVFEEYMARLFASSERYVIVYSSNKDEELDRVAHVRHRKYTDWVKSQEPIWTLVDTVKNRYPFNADDNNTSFADFFVFKRTDQI